MRKTIQLALTGMLVLSAVCLSAQPGPSPPPTSGAAPVDNGALILLVAAAGYGFTRLRKKQQPSI